MIEKPLGTEVVDLDVVGDELILVGEDGPIVDEAEPVTVVETPDGGAEVTVGQADIEADELLAAEHTENLAAYLSDTELMRIGSDLISLYDADLRSRSKWEETYKEGLRLLGLEYEDMTDPWEGASGVFHPVLAEAVVRFQSQTIGEIYPAGGPVKTKVVGRWTDERIAQSRRVKEYMNYVITNRMTEYRRETEQLLWNLPISGAGFRKIYLDPVKRRPAAIYVPPEDIVVNFADSSIETAERITHVMKRSHNWLLRMQASGFYIPADVPEPAPERDAIREKKDELTGTTETTLEAESRHRILEMQVDLDIPGLEHDFPLPYVVTVEKSSGMVLAIYRNWSEGDDAYERVQHIAQYTFIPGDGFYGYGYVHLIGSLADASTSILRQLIDAGTLANLSGGLKTRGLRIKGDDGPIKPGEFRDVDVPAGTINDNIMFLPYKEPSATLYNLLGNLVEDGRRFASMADMKVADMNQEAPVGTTLAILERSMKVQTAIQQRIHESLRQEFKILSRVIKDEGNPEYPYDAGEDAVKLEDFDDRIDILPVSDPNAASFAQKIMKYQAALQLAQGAPQLYDLKLLHRQMLAAMDIEDAERLVPTPEDVEIRDPVAENMAILNLRPVKAYAHQDHEAHIRVLLGLKNDPTINQMLQNSPSGAAVGGAIDAHLREHLSFLYAREIEQELGAELPDPEATIPDDVEKRLSTLVADAADALTGKKAAMAQAEQNAAMMQDPVIQQKQQEIDLRRMEIERKTNADAARLRLEEMKAQINKSTEDRKLDQDMLEMLLDAAAEQGREEARRTLEGLRTGVDIARGITSDTGAKNGR